MAPPVLRPENALKRADELISVGESQAALQSLYDFFTARRIRWAEPSAVEPIVFKFLELGVDLKKGRLIKDGLHQYKKLVQGSPEGLVSVGAVARKYINVIEKKIASEQAKEDAKEEVVDEDLEGGVTPENLLVSVYEQDQSVGGFNDEAITSWMRFTWESYRAVLDLLRNNSQLEITYSGVVNRTMQFCLKNKRKNEFKRLADMLRQHLDAANYQQSKTGTNIVDLSDSDTLQRYLEQRFQLVNCSVKLELWHEAFRSIEDVFHLSKMSKRAPKSSTLALYYENLAKVFYVSNDSLLHTIAWTKFYQLYSKNPNATEGDFNKYASTIFLSALSIKLDDLQTVGYDPQFRLYRLLELEAKPTRKEIITSIIEGEMYEKVDDEIKQLYALMETDFSVESVKSELPKLLAQLSAKPYFAQYTEKIRDIIIRRSIVEASVKNDSMSLEDLITFINLPEPLNLSSWAVENALLDAAMEDYASFNIDHTSNTITFVKDPFTVYAQTTTTAPTEGDEELEGDEIPEEIPEGDEVEEVEEVEGETEEAVVEPEVIVTRNFYIRNKLYELSKTLNEVENFSNMPYFEKIKIARGNLIEQNRESIDKAKKAAEERAKRSQEQKKKYMEENALTAEMDAEERQKRNLEEKTAIEAKLAEEARRRLIDKKRRELDNLKAKVTATAIADINAKGHVYIDPVSAATLDFKDLKTLIVSQLSKDKNELEEKMDYALKRLDYSERSFRKVELPILQKEADELKSVDAKRFEVTKEKIVAAAKVEHEAKLEDHTRLTQVFVDFKNLRENLYNTHEAQFGEKRRELEAKFEEAKQARIAEVRQKRYDELITKRKFEVAAAERMERAKADDELLRKRREMEDASNRRAPAQAPAPTRPSAPVSAPAASAGAPRANPFGAMNDAKRDEIARKQREMEEALEKKAPTPRANPFGAMNDAKRDEIARKQREMEEALEKKTAGNDSTPAPKKSSYVPPSRRTRN